MTTPVTLRGRAATPVRPGLVAKSVLMGETPLATGEFVHEAAITDLHNAYKELVHRENDLRPHARRLKPMTMQSFKTLFKFAQLLGLVELVREEPMQFPPPTGHLYSLRRHDGVHVVISTRRVFRITPIGAEDERSWTNLCRAWIEQWPAPQKAEYLPPVHVRKPPRKRPPEAEIPPEAVLEFTPYEWVLEPSSAQFSSLAIHLRGLNKIGLTSPGVPEEIARLASKVSGWVVVTEEGLDDARAIRHLTAVRRLEGWLTHITGLREALLDIDLPRAVSHLEELIG